MPPVCSNPDLSFELSLWTAGVQHIAGLDEAGRGAWAGPVCAGAVILPDDPGILERLHGVRDSKQMTPRQRAYWAEKIKSQAVTWAVGFATHQEIDQLGILPATRLAMLRALEGLSPQPQHAFIDAVHLKENPLSQTVLIKGDQRSLSISAASVLAKTSRDAVMVEFSQQFPAYGFSQHKGYGTAIHLAALRIQGCCPIHRMSFAPIRNLGLPIDSN